ncbi:MAG: hypothetical protein Q9227_004285 [Pyrenula ochraceoflavens]
MRPDGPRDPVAGSDSGPQSPFPIKLQGPVIKGFGRGSKELGIPTANIPPTGLSAYPDLEPGVYYGYASLLVDEQGHHLSSSSDPKVYDAVLSIGFNPFYKNTVKSVEIHILHKFPPANQDFYHTPLNLLILGFIRPEYDYVSVESLIEDINVDCAVAVRSLARVAYQRFKEREEWLKGFGWWEERDVEGVERRVLGEVREGVGLE